MRKREPHPMLHPHRGLARQLLVKDLIFISRTVGSPFKSFKQVGDMIRFAF